MALGRTSWSGEIFAMILGQSSHVALIKLHITSNGGTIGDAWGEFVDATGHADRTYPFTVGEWLFFSRNEAKTLADFNKETGTCEFLGPYKR
jgi:hypothetical protein